MKMMISDSEYEANIRGYRITDCAIRNERVFYILMRNCEEADAAGILSESSVTKRVLNFLPKGESGARLGHFWFEGREAMSIAASRGGEDKLLCVESDGAVIAIGGGKAVDENPISKSRAGPRRGAIRRVRTIEGTVYAVGTGHTVCRRLGGNQWESMCFDLPLGTAAEHADDLLSEDMAFKDVDGFSGSDLYAVAGRGVVWHCNGARWRRIGFPSNMLLESVCCAGDGNVYIGAQSGSLFRGREDRWQLIYRGGLSLPFHDIVWHAGQLWCTSDYGLWKLEGGKLVQADLPREVVVCAGNLAVGCGAMLLAGSGGAAFHDGENWRLIFGAERPD